MDTRVETPTLYDDDAGGNASGDDPAIWVHPSDSRRSIVIVTAKEGGLRVYDLRGRQLQKLAATPAPRPDGVPGRSNNVDIARGLMVGGKRTDVAVVSDRYNDQLRFFAINPAGAAATRQLREVTAPGVPFVFQHTRAGVDTEKTAYGLFGAAEAHRQGHRLRHHRPLGRGERGVRTGRPRPACDLRRTPADSRRRRRGDRPCRGGRADRRLQPGRRPVRRLQPHRSK
ncbi:phytase [Nostocoides australiense]